MAALNNMYYKILSINYMIHRFAVKLVFKRYIYDKALKSLF